MPKVGLSLGSSFEKLFNKAPAPSKLRVFDYLCFPYLHPYSSNKLDPKSSPCVFLGYSLTQSAFLYFDPTYSQKNICVSSCQVWGKRIHVYVSIHLRQIGNGHKLCTPHLVVHLVDLPRTVVFPTITLHVPPLNCNYPSSITAPILSSNCLCPTCISPTHIVDLAQTVMFIIFTPPIISLNCICPVYIPDAYHSNCWTVGSGSLTTLF